MKKHKIYLYIILIVCSLILIKGSFIIKGYLTYRNKSNMEQGFISYKKGDYSVAFKAFLNEDVIYNPVASFIVGEMYMNGKGVDKNKERAIMYYEKAALYKYAPAHTTLAIIYFNDGEIDKAISHAKIASDLNDAEASMLLATLYENGFIDKDHNLPDYKTAALYYEKASQLGNLDAKTALMSYYKIGRTGINKNEYKAARLQKEIKSIKDARKKLGNINANE